MVNGETKDLAAYEEHGDSITFVQYQAGAMGLNLQKANRIIYFALTDRSELFEQSKKRIHRIGQEKTCFYYLMICPGTVEEDILHTLELRKDYTDELFKNIKKASIGKRVLISWVVVAIIFSLVGFGNWGQSVQEVAAAPNKPNRKPKRKF